MNEDALERRQPWWTAVVTVPNVIAAGMMLAAVVSWQRTTEARNEMQDMRLQTIEQAQKEAAATYMRADLADQRLRAIEFQVSELKGDIARGFADIKRAVK